MKQRFTLLPLTISALLFTYATFGGATPNGMLNPRHRVLSLGILALLVVGWLLIRWRQRWKWYCTPFDSVIMIWIAVIVFSFIMNPEHWRRSLIGGWYIALYIGLWFIVHDALANERLTRSVLLKAFLISGVPVIIFGLLELWQWLEPALAALNAGKSIALPRLASTLNNPNPLATFLFVLLICIVSTFFTVTAFSGRLLLILYGLVTGVLLFLTGTRGGLLGTVAGLATLAALLLIDNPVLVANVRAWWQQRTRALQIALIGSIVFIIIAGLMIATPAVTRFFTGRGDYRPFYYRASIQQFLERPLTGYGLFTVGEGFLRLGSSPPNEIVGHAHNAVLNIAAELGIPGLLALLFTTFVAFKAAQNNWKTQDRGERMITAGASAALVGVAVHHLFDVTATVAVIALTILFLLTMLTTSQTLPLISTRRARIQPLLLTGLWGVLITAGLWSNAIYTRYNEIVLYGLSTGDYLNTAKDFQQIIDADPTIPVYPLYQGYFFGLAANNGDMAAAQDGIATYLNFLEMEPYYAPAWINLGALYWQVGAHQDAIRAMQKAVDLTPEFWVTPFILGMYQEQAGQIDAAQQSYQRALQIDPDASLYPEWQRSDLTRVYTPLNTPQSSDLARTTTLLLSGSKHEAQALWYQIPSEMVSQPESRLLGIAVALVNEDPPIAQAQLEALQKAAETNKWAEQVALPLGTAMIAQFDSDAANDDVVVEQMIAELTPLINPGYSSFSEDRVAEYASSQFWRVGIGNYALPQVPIPAGQPITRLLFEQLKRGFFKQIVLF